MGSFYRDFLNISGNNQPGMQEHILAGVRGSTSSFERFVPVEGVPISSRAVSIPHCEILNKPEKESLQIVANGSVEDFYKNCHRLGLDAEVDAILLEKALPKSLQYKEGVSINLCSRTAYSEGLITVLEKIEHDPQRVMFEISEAKIDGFRRIPAEYNPQALALLQKRGFLFAMDDLQLIGEDMESLSIFPYIDAIKFDHNIAACFRKGGLTGDRCDRENVELAMEHIWAISRLCPHALLILEGFRKTDDFILPMLREAGIHVVQESSYVDPMMLHPNLSQAGRPAGLELLH